MLAYTQKEVAKRHDSAKANNAVTLRRLCVKDDFAVRRDILVLKIVRISTTYHPRIEIVVLEMDDSYLGGWRTNWKRILRVI